MRQIEGITIMDNIVRISAKKRITDYAASVLMRIQPKTYEKYGCVRLRFTKDLEQQAMYLAMMWWHCGFDFKKYKLKGGVKVAGGILIGDIREIHLKKIGAIIFQDDSDFISRWKKAEYEELEEIN